MGTCCSTDSRPANGDAVIGDDFNTESQNLKSSKGRQVHSRAPGEDVLEDVHQNPEIQAQEIELRLQQSEQEGHSAEKPEKVHGESRGEERRQEGERHHGESRGEEKYHIEVRDEERVDGEVERREENQTEEKEGERREIQAPVEETMRESEHGVTYYVDAHTQALIRIQVNATEAKGYVKEVETKIRSENEHLRSISISFSVEETENMDYFITDLLKTSSYTSINVMFASLTMFSEQALHTFSEIIANSHLEKLYIMHIAHDATDHFFATLMPAVQTRKATLKELSIQSGNCQELSDETIKHVKDAIEWNEVLEYVALYFGNTSKITDKGITDLRSAFNLKSKLKKLELGFMNMTQLTDEALVPLCEIAEGLHNLESLDIITTEAGFTEEKYKKFQAVINGFNLKNVNLFWRDEAMAEMHA